VQFIVLTRGTEKQLGACTYYSYGPDESEYEIKCSGGAIPEDHEKYDRYSNEQCSFYNMRTVFKSIECKTLTPDNVSTKYFKYKPYDCYKFKGEEYFYCTKHFDELPKFKYTDGKMCYNNGEKDECSLENSVISALLKGVMNSSFLGPSKPTRITYEEVKAGVQAFELSSKSGITVLKDIFGIQQSDIDEINQFLPTLQPNDKLTSIIPANTLKEYSTTLDESVTLFSSLLDAFDIDKEKMKSLISKMGSNPDSVTYKDVFFAFDVTIPTIIKYYSEIGKLLNGNSKIIDCFKNLGYSESEINNFVKAAKDFFVHDSITFIKMFDILSNGYKYVLSTMKRTFNILSETIVDVMNVFFRFVDVSNLPNFITKLSSALKEKAINDLIDTKEITAVLDSIVKDGLDVKGLLGQAVGEEEANKIFTALLSILGGKDPLFKTVALVADAVGIEGSDIIIIATKALDKAAEGKTIKEILNAFNPELYDNLSILLTDIADSTKDFSEIHFIGKFKEIVSTAISFCSYITSDVGIGEVLGYTNEDVRELKNLATLPLSDSLRTLFGINIEPIKEISTILEKILVSIDGIKEISISPKIDKGIKIVIDKVSAFITCFKSESSSTLVKLLNDVISDKADWESIYNLFMEPSKPMKTLLDALNFENGFIVFNETLKNIGLIGNEQSKRKKLEEGQISFTFKSLSDAIVVPSNSDFSFNDIIPIKTIYKLASENTEMIKDGTISLSKVTEVTGIDLQKTAKEAQSADYTSRKLIETAIDGTVSPKIIDSIATLVEKSNEGNVSLDAISKTLSEIKDSINSQEIAEEEKIGAGTIIGIVIGCVAGVGIIAGLVWYFGFRKKEDNITADDNGDFTIGTAP